MESGLHKQFWNLQTPYDFVEVVLAWSLFPYVNKLCNFNVLVPCIQRYMIYMVLLLHGVSKPAYKDMTLDISSSKIWSEF